MGNILDKLKSPEKTSAPAPAVIPAQNHERERTLTPPKPVALKSPFIEVIDSVPASPSAGRNKSAAPTTDLLGYSLSSSPSVASETDSILDGISGLHFDEAFSEADFPFPETLAALSQINNPAPDTPPRSPVNNSRVWIVRESPYVEDNSFTPTAAELELLNSSPDSPPPLLRLLSTGTPLPPISAKPAPE